MLLCINLERKFKINLKQGLIIVKITLKRLLEMVKEYEIQPDAILVIDDEDEEELRNVRDLSFKKSENLIVFY